MIDWIKTAQGVAAISAAIFATMVAWWNLGLPRLVFSPELARIHAGSAALKQFNRAPGSSPHLVARQPARDALAGDGCGVRGLGGETAARRRWCGGRWSSSRWVGRAASSPGRYRCMG